MVDSSTSGSGSSGSPESPAAASDSRARAADVLLDKRRLLAEAQRIAHIGSWRQDLGGGIVWSDEMYRIHGVTPRAFAPTSDKLQALIHPDDRAAMHEQVATAFAGGPTAELELRVLRPDGSERSIVARTEGQRSPQGKVAYVTGTFQDISERRWAERAVREAAGHYRLLFEANPHPMWIYDEATLRFLAVNDAAVGRYGYPRDEFLGMSLNDISVHEKVPRLREVANLVAGDPEQGSLWRHRLKDGRLIDMEIIAQTIDFEGRPARVVLAHDVNERRRAAQEVLDSREALRALVQRLQRAQEEERARISREVHDELGQLLTGLKMDLRWLERRLSEPTLPPALHSLLDRSVAASALIDQTIAAVQKLASDLRPGALDHLGLADALAQRAREFRQRSGMACALEAAEPLPALPTAVADELFYICQEALTNIARHAQATEVKLRLRPCDGGVRLEVEDNGVGIDPAMVTAGRSLGLLGMRERALHCGGTVRIEAAAPRGTLVVVQVPLKAEAG
jgi:PAS domain S-box-containing protein